MKTRHFRINNFRFTAYFEALFSQTGSLDRFSWSLPKSLSLLWLQSQIFIVVCLVVHRRELLIRKGTELAFLVSRRTKIFHKNSWLKYSEMLAHILNSRRLRRYALCIFSQVMWRKELEAQKRLYVKRLVSRGFLDELLLETGTHQYWEKLKHLVVKNNVWTNP